MFDIKREGVPFRRMSPWMVNFFVYWLPVIVYAGTIGVFSSFSAPASYFPGWAGEMNDKVVHALEYGLLAILCYRAFLYASSPRLAEYAGILAILLATLYGISDEFHQYFVPLRVADPWDLVADALGSVMGVTCWQKISPRVRVMPTSAEG